MKKTYCDRCGREIPFVPACCQARKKSYSIKRTCSLLTMVGDGTEEMDLCSECEEQLDKFMRPVCGCPGEEAKDP